MAATDEGQALTTTHKRRQVVLGAQAELEAAATWRLLDLDDLDASTPSWLAVQVGRLRGRYATSRSLAERYLTDYRAVELGSTAGPLVAPTFEDAAAARMLLGSGPRLTKLLIGRGTDPLEAFDMARRTAAGQTQKWALSGGRGVLTSTARVDRRAVYRRVSDGNPCAFCAMLVARSIEFPNSFQAGFRAHPGCGCSGELRYEDQDTYTDTEAEFVDAYRQAAAQARAAGEPVVAPSGRRRRDTVLWRMRRNRPDLFSDGVHAH